MRQLIAKIALSALLVLGVGAALADSADAASYVPKNEWKQGSVGICRFRVKQDLYTRIKIQALNNGCQILVAAGYCFHTDSLCAKANNGSDDLTQPNGDNWVSGETVNLVAPSQYQFCYADVAIWDHNDRSARWRYDSVSGSFTRQAF